MKDRGKRKRLSEETFFILDYGRQKGNMSAAAEKNTGVPQRQKSPFDLGGNKK